MTDINSMVAENLVEKDNMKVDLSRADSDIVQHNFYRSDRVALKVSQISMRVNNINDSFYLNSTTNGVLNTNILGDRRTTTTTITVTVNI